MAIRASALNARIKGLQVEFANIFTNRLSASRERVALDRVMGRIANKLDSRDADFHYFTAPPGFRRWDEDTKRTYGRLFDRSWKVPVLKCQSAIEWNRIDEEDDLTGRFRSQLAAIANKSILIDVEAFFQILTGATDPDRLKTLPLASDGLSLFSSSRTDFGTGGNIVTGSGIATVAQIKADFFSARKKFTGLVDQHGDLYHDPEIFNEGVTILFNDDNLERFAEAFQAKIIQGTAAGIENIVMSTSWAGNVTLWPTPRITDNSWYMHLDGQPERAIFALERKDIGSEPEVIIKTERESDYCSENDCRRMLFRKRTGYGISQPQGLCQVTN